MTGLRRRPVALTVAIGLASLAIALGITLSGAPLVVAQTNGVRAEADLATAGGSGACQGSEFVPAGISAIRVSLLAAAGPRVGLKVLSEGRMLTSGFTGSGWTSGAVTVPVKPLSRSVFPATICFAMGRGVESVALDGAEASPAAAAKNLEGKPLSVRFVVEDMRPSAGSWWSSISAVAKHMGLGRIPYGVWIPLLVLLVMGLVVALSCWLTVKELER